jgi:hypothetical protein
MPPSSTFFGVRTSPCSLFLKNPEDFTVHRNRALLIFLLSSLLVGQVIEAVAQEPGPKANSGLVQKALDRASFEFSNESMYRDQNKWIGQTIAFRGRFTRYPDILNTDKPYEECSGSNANNDPVDVIVFFDTPVLVQPKNVMSAQTVSTTEVYRLFGIVEKCREVISRTGAVKVLPVIDLLLVYRADDQTFQYPVWVSKSLQN